MMQNATQHAAFYSVAATTHMVHVGGGWCKDAEMPLCFALAICVLVVLGRSLIKGFGEVVQG